jgi:DNA-binding transcriptional ArsR family regulator
MSRDAVNLERAGSELRGTTLRVYWHLFRLNRSVGVREIQRALNLSSPSVALHHLEKLRELGLVRKDEYSRYCLAEEVKVGVLRFFTRFGRLILPRYLFYAVFFTATLIFYVTQFGFAYCIHNVMAIILGLSAASVSWYEVAQIWREKLF